MYKGDLLLLLHAHLPYVRHPEHEYFLEENWLYEAMIETYIPLISLFERLLNDRVNFKITLSLSPTLLEMFDDPLLKQRFQRHINSLIELTEKEMLRTKKDVRLGTLSRMYNKNLKKIRHIYEKHYGRDLIDALRRLEETDNIEVITTAATHAYLPNLCMWPQAVRAQIEVSKLNHIRFFSRPVKGMWLPECGYYEGLDHILKEAGIRFFFMESHGILYGRPRPRYGIFRPVRCQSYTVAFGRDSESSRQVWSMNEGYPGDPDYRDFYRDIGFDLPIKYIRPYIHPDGIRIPTGIKYYRITGKTKKKMPYMRHKAVKKAKIHAGDFISKRQANIEHLSHAYGFTPLITAAYDAELFGHWWFEGVDWLEFLLRGLCSQGVIRMTTPTEYLSENQRQETVSPSMSSWGQGGYGTIWCSSKNNWALRHIHKACKMMSLLKQRFPDAHDPLIKRALNQALRELLLMQASDWLFMITTETSPHYGQQRLTLHIKTFKRLYEMIMKAEIDERFVWDAEQKDRIFPSIDYRVYGRSLS